MERNTALGAAAGVVLAVVGAVSALFLTIDRPAEAATDEPVVEFVDQYGNPATAPVANAAPDIVLVNPDGTLVEPPAPEASTAHGGDYEEHGEEADHEDEEHGEEYEDEEETEEEYEDEEEEEDEDDD